MSFPPSIDIYVFGGGEQVEKSISDERIHRCAELFIGSKRRSDSGVFVHQQQVLPAIKRQDGAKPCFETDVGLHFSVSHSGRFWICAFSEQEVGIDIQNKTKFHPQIVKRFFHQDEQVYLERNHFEDFFNIWVAKESYVKYTGEGITEEFSAFSVVKDGGISERVGDARIRILSFASDYCLCLCAGVIGEVRIQVL